MNNAAPISPSPSTTANQPQLAFVPLSRLRQDDANVRETYEGIDELAASIAEHGILQPLLVEPQADDSLLVIAGNRRFLAATKAGLSVLPVQIRAADASTKVAVQLVENIQRADLSAVETAEALKRVMDTMPASRDRAEQLGLKIGKSANWVTRHTQLLKSDPRVLEAMRRHRLGIKNALAVTAEAKLHGVDKGAELAMKLKTGEAKVTDSKPGERDTVKPTVPRVYEKRTSVFSLRVAISDMHESKEAMLRADLDSLVARYGGAK